MDKKATFIIFILALWMPFINMHVGIFPEGTSHEKRTPAKYPELQSLSLKNIKGFLANYETYFNDNFGFRNTLINLNNWIHVNLFHMSLNDKLIVGKKGWIFYRSERVNDGRTINDYQGKIPFSNDQLEKIGLQLELITNQLRNMNIFFLVVIVPNKETIYSEYLPDSIKKFGNKTRLEQLSEALKHKSNIHFINLKEDLLNAKSKTKYHLYYRGGTHWNQYGAFYGYQRIIDYLTPFFPEMNPFSIDDFEIIPNENSATDSWFSFVKGYDFTFTPTLSRQIDSTSISPYNPDIAIVKKIPNSRFPRLVMFRDSFGGNLIPFMSEHFSRSLYLSADFLDYEFIRQERPDIVILELVERYLYYSLGRPRSRGGEDFVFGVKYYKTGEYDKARKYFEQAILRDHNNQELMNYLGATYEKLKAYDKAKTILTETVSKFPYWIDAYYSLGIVYNRSGNYSSALTIYQELLNTNISSEETHFCIGETYFNMADYSTAVEEYKKVININPKRFECYYKLAYISAIKKDFQTTIDWLTKAVDAGFRDFESVEKDKAFAAIVGHEKFKKIKSILNKN